MTNLAVSNNEIVPGFDDEKDDSLRIRLQKIEGIEKCLALSLTGYVDTYNSNHFQKRVAKAIEAGYTKLVFDFGGLSYISSTGIGTFTFFLRTLKSQKGDLVLLNIQPKVFEVFQLLGFSQFFNIQESLDEAALHFRDHERAIATSTFPYIFKCPVCSKKLKAVKAGRFRCSECKTVVAIKEDGIVSLP